MDSLAPEGVNAAPHIELVNEALAYMDTILEGACDAIEQARWTPDDPSELMIAGTLVASARQLRNIASEILESDGSEAADLTDLCARLRRVIGKMPYDSAATGG